jgi:prephenate dehydratase
LERLDPAAAADIVVNVQGDLPTLDPADIRAALAALADPAVDIATIAAEIRAVPERTNPNVVKVVGTPVGPARLRALYFTRATAPFGEGSLYHHIGLYAYRRTALAKFVHLPPSPLERREKLEQLRALEAGMRIDVAIVGSVPLGVDTAEDLERARVMLTSPSNPSAQSPEFTGTTCNSGNPMAAATAALKIVFQGERGANSHIACREAYPDAEPIPCRTFEDALNAVATGDADLGMIPIENSVAGRVADIHHLMPGAGLHIIAEWFLPIRNQLLALPGVRLAEIKSVESHIMALGQCRNYIRERGVKSIVAADTAGAAREVAERGDRSCAAIASRLAAEIYGLDIIAENIEDESHSTTRFVVLSRSARRAARGNGPVLTTFVFQVRNIPAALYKALGGFATNGVNMTKLESYMLEGTFSATQFYSDVDGHPDDPGLGLALEELAFFSQPNSLKILGVYPAHPFRKTIGQAK